jgi:DNA-binding transcriptional regulator PaaX
MTVFPVTVFTKTCIISSTVISRTRFFLLLPLTLPPELLPSGWMDEAEAEAEAEP